MGLQRQIKSQDSHNQTKKVLTNPNENLKKSSSQLYQNNSENTRKKTDVIDETGFVTIKEASMLEGIKPNSMVKRLLRIEDAVYKEVDNPKGGKPIKLVHVSVLSETAQKIFKKHQVEKLDTAGTIVKVLGKKLNKANPPWYVHYDYSSYQEHYKENWEDGLRKVEAVKEKQALIKNITDGTIKIAERYSTTKKSLERWEQDYKTAAAWAYVLEQETGSSYDFFKVMALCRKPNAQKDKHWSLTSRAKILIENTVVENVKNNLGTEQICRIIQLKAHHLDTVIPSYTTLRRYINEFRQNYKHEIAYAKMGKRNYENKYGLKSLRDSQSIDVMECVMGDAHTFDVWVEYKGRAIRPILVAWMDVRSRCIVGWAICAGLSASIIQESLRYLVLPKPNVPFYGVPKYIYIDNGLEYTAHKMIGRHRNRQKTKKQAAAKPSITEMDNDAEDAIQSFYKSIGIEREIRALPYHAWAKGQIERWFNTLIEQFSKLINSYTGTLTASKTSQKIEKDIKGMLERGEIPTWYEFIAGFQRFLKDYHGRVHSSLKQYDPVGDTPLSVYKKAKKYFKAPPPAMAISNYMKERRKAFVYPVGIKCEGGYYKSEELAKLKLIKKKVNIRYDIRNMDSIMIYDDKFNYLATIPRADKIPFVAKSDEDKEKYGEATKAVRRQIKAVKDTLGYLSFDEEERKAFDLKKEADFVTGEISTKINSVVAVDGHEKEVRNAVKASNDKKKAEQKQKQVDLADQYYYKKGQKLAKEFKIGG